MIYSESTPNRRPGKHPRFLIPPAERNVFSQPRVSESDRIPSLDFFCPRGQRLLVGTISPVVHQRDTRTLGHRGREDAWRVCRGESVIVSPDRSLIAVGEDRDNPTEIKIHDGASGELRHRTEQRGCSKVCVPTGLQQLLIGSQTAAPTE